MTAPDKCSCPQDCGRPTYKRGYSMACYQRWTRAGKPAEGPGVPMTRIQRIERRSQVRAALKATAPPPAAVADYALAEATRRVGREQSRAAAYLAVRGGRDQIAPRRVLERVGDAEAFRVLVGCQGSAKAAVRLLAALEPAIADEESAA